MSVKRSLKAREQRGLSSILQIIWTDYTAFISAFLPVVIWAVILFNLRGPFFIQIGIGATLVTVFVLLWRIRLIQRIIDNGHETPGNISSVHLRRDRGRVEYTYIYQGREYQSGVAIHRNSKTRALKAGERVQLAVDRKKPERAFIRSLYI